MVGPPMYDADSPGIRQTRREGWHRRYWGYTSRPYAGCGCLYLVAIFLVVWLILSLFIDAVRIY